MTIDWQAIRTLGNSKNTAFEELCSQLARHETVQNASRFVRVGTPDAGVECYWIKSDGSEVGWQAKYFPSSLSSGQWKQIDDSVTTVLGKHPKLTDYYVCLPIDRSDARIDGQESLMDKWNSHVEKWKRWASQKGMTVEFHYWGSSELWDRLSRTEHQGRVKFWFDRDLFDLKWFEHQVRQNVSNVGERYSPKLNFDLPIAKVFDGLAQTPRFFERLESHYKHIEAALERASTAAATSFLPTEYSDLAASAKNLEISLVEVRDNLPAKLNFEQVRTHCTASLRIAEDIESKLATEGELERQKRREEREKTEEKGTGHYYDDRDAYDSSRYHLRRLYEPLWGTEEFITTSECKSVNDPFLVMYGPAGTGKTHLFCDIAEGRVSSNLPTLLLLGQHFGDGAPFSQIENQLGLHAYSRDELLGALDAAGEAMGSKTLILIDALNESDNRKIWKNHLAGVVQVFARYPWISVAVSVRTSYKDTVIPAGLQPVIEVEHEGFAGKVFEATDFFFKEFGIKAPSIPVLTPEFNNPLFLKTFCTAIRNKGLSEVPKGLHGLTSVFAFYVDSLNTKLYEVLGVAEKDRVVQAAIERLIDSMAQKDEVFLLRQDAKNIVSEVHTAERYENTLYAHLVSEGLLAEDIKYDHGISKPVDITRFTYEKFTDNILASHLIDKYLDETKPKRAFVVSGGIGKHFKDEWDAYRSKGILEALSIQLPERIGKELFEVAPRLKSWRITREVFVQSLMWREPAAITDSTRKFVNDEVLRYQDSNEEFWDALITISSNPAHAWNALFLHAHLTRYTMAKRDAWWSIFLHRHFINREYSAIDRLIDWAWSSSDKTHIDDDSILLSGITLSWFFTTANRFLRDRATKALVALFTTRAHLLPKLLDTFADVNDMYVRERLFASAYGCAMRSPDKEAIFDLASHVYQIVFAEGTPIPHFLFRDYARGIVEIALAKGWDAHINKKMIRPPYRSEFPATVPSESEVKAKYFPSMDNDKYSSGNDVYYSLMGGMSDFGRYVINSDVGKWRNRLLDDPMPAEVITRKFENGLTEKQRKVFIDYQSVRYRIDEFKKEGKKKQIERFGKYIYSREWEAVSEIYADKVRSKLGKRKREIFDKVVIKHLKTPWKKREDYAFPVAEAQRWMLNRVYELGWNDKAFGEFDHNLNRNSTDYRTSHKAERIGKKYQWIALHEFLALLADNFQYGGDMWSDAEDKYEGTWQEFRRDIDPSNLLKSTKEIFWLRPEPSWWFDNPYDFENIEEVTTWLKDTSDLPKVEPLLERVHPQTDVTYLNLDCHFEWQDGDIEIGLKSDSRKVRLWYGVQAFLVKKADFAEVVEWAKNKRVSGVFDRGHTTQVYVGEYYWSPAYRYYDSPYYLHLGWSNFQGLPKPILMATEEYGHETSSLDCSLDSEASMRMQMPSRYLSEEMGLSWQGKEGHHFDKDGKMVFFDPCVHERGCSAALIDKVSLLKFLKESELEIIWFLTGEKLSYDERVYRHAGGRPLIISGVFYFASGKLAGQLHAHPEDRN